LFGETAMSGELAADDREETTQARGMVVDDVLAGDRALGAGRDVGKGADAAVRVEDVVPRELGAWEEGVRLGEEVVDLAVVGAHVVEVALVADVGAADQV